MLLASTGLSHKTAPVEVRERVAFHPGRQQRVLAAMTQLPDVSEALLLSTCNRTELHMVGRARGWDQDPSRLLAEAAGLSPEELEPYLYRHEGFDAVCHFFEVACGADSMVIGESEIAAQIKDAARIARGAGSLGKVLSRFTDCALQTSKRVRTETAICQGNTSVASTAVALARRIFGELASATVLILGAGDTAQLVVKRLLAAGARTILVSNRTHERAVQLAQLWGGEAVLFSEIYDRMEHADIVVGSTAAPHALIRLDQMRDLMRLRKGRAIFLIDLAVPRDIQPEVGSLENVFLYDIDDLQGVVAEAADRREEQLPRVRDICRDDARKFWRWATSLPLLPTIAAVTDTAECVRRTELERTLGKLEPLTPRQRKELDLMTRRIVHGIVTEPLARAKAQACADKPQSFAGLLRAMFAIDDGTEQSAGSDGED